MNERTNIVFIAIDALRAKNLGCYGYSKKVSPNIDNLAISGLLFEDAYTCINYTDPSFTTIFTGKYPLSHGIINHGPKLTDREVKRFYASEITLLPEILQKNGYTTLGVDWLFRWHKRGYDYYSGTRVQSTPHGFLKQQFRKFPVLRKVIKPELINKIREKVFKGSSKPCENAKNVTKQAMNLIKENKNRNLFLFLHYWDTHVPYSPPSQYIKRANKKEMEELRQLFVSSKFKENFNQFEERIKGLKETVLSYYDGEITFIDYELARLFEFLKKSNLMDNSLIILTSDHGESLVEHGIYMEHHGLYDQTLHVPLIILHPDLPKDKRIKGFVQHFDIMPTILDIVNLQHDVEFDGTSILPLINGEKIHSAIYAEESQWQRKRAIRTEEWKYIYALSEEGNICKRCGHPHGAKEELYNLMHDPKETKNVIKKESQIAAQLRNQVENWIKRFPYEELPTGDINKIYKGDIDKVEERLKGLGYI